VQPVTVIEARNECRREARSQKPVPMALWTYAYFVTGTPWLIPWGKFLARWAAEWLPNLEAETGLLLVITGSVPLLGYVALALASHL
jgi:hypothetical protein